MGLSIKEKSTIRTSAYTLFGELARFGSGPSKDPYMEQIHSNFVSFILHLNEEDESVKKACKLVLKKSGQLIQSDQINELFQTCLLEKKHLHYGEFINDLSKLLVTEFPEKISFYIMNSVSNFKSQWTEIRSNAVLFAGYMLGHLDKESQSVLSKEHITNGNLKVSKLIIILVIYFVFFFHFTKSFDKTSQRRSIAVSTSKGCRGNKFTQRILTFKFPTQYFI